MTSSSACSEPIRISPAAGSTSTTTRRDRDEGSTSSSAELERFYDQATWRMYMLIQSARLAQDDFETAGGPCDNHNQHQPKQQQRLFQPSQQWNTASHPAVAAAAVSDEEVEEDEAIFDMEL